MSPSSLRRVGGHCAALTGTRVLQRTFPVPQGFDWELSLRRQQGFHRLRVSAPALLQTAHAIAASSHLMPTARVVVLKWSSVVIAGSDFILSLHTRAPSAEQRGHLES